MTNIKPGPEKFKLRDYLTRPDCERWEIIDGVPYKVASKIEEKYQHISKNIEVYLVTESRWKDRIYQVFDATTDVIFDEYNLVKPDVFVICDTSRIEENKITTPPDLIIEVSSPSTTLKDKREKKRLYEKFCVKEYIILYPEDELAELFSLNNDKYGAPEVFNWDETMRTESLELDLHLWEIFKNDNCSRSQTEGVWTED